MVEFDLDTIINKKIGIHCETKEEAKELEVLLSSLYKDIKIDTSLEEKWLVNEDCGMFYIVHRTVCNAHIDYYKDRSLDVVQFKDIKRKYDLDLDNKMVEFDLDSLSGNIAVHCDTQEKYRELLKWINSNVFNIQLDSFLYKHKENTCILIYDDIHSEYIVDDNKDRFIRDKYKVISYKEALLKPTKEVNLVEFNKDLLLSDVAVHCDTEEKYRELLRWLNNNILKIPLDKFLYMHDDKTCLDISNDGYNNYTVYDSTLDFLVSGDFKVISYEEALLKPTKKPVKQGDIVLAKRDDGFETQAIYYGEINGKYAVDFNGTSCMIVDSVEILPTYTKTEAKQKVSELFTNPKNVSSDKVRKIIDRISL